MSRMGIFDRVHERGASEWKTFNAGEEEIATHILLSKRVDENSGMFPVTHFDHSNLYLKGT